MAFAFQDQFDSAVEQRSKDYFATLSEKDRRRFAAIEAQRLGHGGIAYICDLLGVSRSTIERGIHEMNELPQGDPAKGRVRRAGGGRKKKVDSDSELESNLIDSLKLQTAGDPDDPDITFTSQTPAQVARQATENGTPVHRNTVKDWYRKIGLSLRQMQKDIPGGQSPDRQQQFELIGDLIETYQTDGNPILSIDTKAKEFLGRLYRKGRVYGTAALHAFDHDFPSWADGKLIPHGIFDIMRNVGHINIGLSRDTSEFAIDSLRWYWNRIGKRCYPDATSLLLLCDCGGSNSANSYLFKYYLEQLSRSIDLPLRVAHFPSYCSKYNPIERRFFCHVSRACSGRLFDSLQTVVELMRQTSTQQGLRATVNVIDRIYEMGQKLTNSAKASINIIREQILPNWNYSFTP